MNEAAENSDDDVEMFQEKARKDDEQHIFIIKVKVKN
jgi:hypothetical protein